MGYVHGIEEVQRYGSATGNKIRLHNIGIHNIKVHILSYSLPTKGMEVQNGLMYQLKKTD